MSFMWCMSLNELMTYVMKYVNEIMNAMTSVKKVCQWNKYLSRVVNGCLVNVWMGQRNGHFVSYLDES